jgi:hypothetical protein
MADLPLDIPNDLAGIGFVPTSIEVLSRHAELNDEVVGQVLRLNLAPLFTSQPY